MTISAVEARGLVLLGCGKMGSALLDGWLNQGIPASAFTIIDPAPSPWLAELAEQGLHLNTALPVTPAVAILAVKPQMMEAALPQLSRLADGKTIIVSIAAGTPISVFEEIFGKKTPIVRAMPNTPAAVGKGITALVGNDAAGSEALGLAEELMAAVGQTVRLESETQMDAVTAVSGSGPAYVFLMIEALAAAGEAEGLTPDLALALSRATVAGAGALAQASSSSPSQLRINVTSPGGTTAAALDILMQPEHGLTPLIRKAVARAAVRSRELSGKK